ncbi:hypothetical protein LSH36_89g08021 [Paralvinella palmiformis]|uniref:Peptidoglycan recognition protein family domain-containing protein n=1 Tax=Paralvinella palmiformis TaxID=53620 RepID=A0AAD9K2X7_9ANNE|nr:hypothetical protein LSH36_89g08021 [Paralvinella palmiformis]
MCNTTSRLHLALLLCAVAVMCFLQTAEGWPFWGYVLYNKGRLGGKINQEQCASLNKAIIKRNEWGAISAREVSKTKGIAKDVIVWHTGPDTCDMIGLDQSTCERCPHDTDCMKRAIFSLQQDDLDNGLDDIKYNFLIDDQGVIYEGRGWGFVGQHTVGMNAMSIGIAVIGDFTSSEPTQAVQDSLSRLIQCGIRSNYLLYNTKLIVTPSRAEPQQTKRLVPVLAHSPMPKLNTPPPANTSRYGRTLKPPKVHVDYQTD